MLAGELYCANDPHIQADLAATAAWLARYNASLSDSPDARFRLLRERLGFVGEDSQIRPPFFCDYGFNIRIGRGVFLNFNCVILDVVGVTIGDGTQIGPAVQIYAADHPPILRRDAQGWNSAGPSRSDATCGSAGRHHPSRRYRGRRGRHRCRQRRYARCGAGRHGGGQPCRTSPFLTGSSAKPVKPCAFPGS
jgi:hypothetical protein